MARSTCKLHRYQDVWTLVDGAIVDDVIYICRSCDVIDVTTFLPTRCQRSRGGGVAYQVNGRHAGATDLHCVSTSIRSWQYNCVLVRTSGWYHIGDNIAHIPRVYLASIIYSCRLLFWVQCCFLASVKAAVVEALVLSNKYGFDSIHFYYEAP